MSVSFGCPRCGSNRIYEVNSTYVSYEVIAWNEDGEPEKFGEPDYSDYNEEFDTYECRDCLLAHPDKCMFNEPARLPLEVDHS